MANRRRENIRVRDAQFDPGPQGLGQPTAYASAGQDQAALSGVALALSEKAGRFADELAVVEGTRAGLIAGQDPAYRPDDGLMAGTLRQRSHDKAATDVYFSNVMARYRADAQTVFEENRDNPAGLASAMQRLQQRYSDKDVFPEIKGYFDASAQNIGSSLRLQAMRNFETRRKDENRAQLVSGMMASDDARRRLLAINPDDPATEKEVLRLRDENIARIRAGMDDQTITRTQGVGLIAAEHNKAWGDLYESRAARMNSPGEIDAYRAQIRDAWAKGKIPDFSDFEAVNARLAKMSQALGTRQRAQLNALDGRLDGFLARFGDGRTPSAAEWLQLESEARQAGPAGLQKLEMARAKLGVRVKINSLPLDQAEEYVRGLEREAKKTPATGTPAENLIMRKLREAGFSAVQAAGVLGNLVQESSLNPNARNPGDGRDGSDSIGIAQWNAERAQALRAFAQARGKPVNDLETQVDFMIAELGGREGRAGAALRAARTVDEATAAFIGYERPKGWSEANPRGGHGWANRLRQAQRLASTGATVDQAELIKDARTALDVRKNLINSDPLLAAEREGRVQQVAPVDFSAAPDALQGQIAARIAQGDAVADGYGRAPAYLREADKARARAVLEGGGQKALDALAAVVAGAGPKAPAVLKEIGGNAPALAHAGLVLHATGDRAFAAQVMEAQRARKVPGAKPPAALAQDVDKAMREVMGGALNGLSPEERERTRAAAVLWAEREFVRRNIDPKIGAGDVLALAIRKARGETMRGSDSFGGLERLGGWGGNRGQIVQIPADVKNGEFMTLIRSITADDLKGLADPPVNARGDIVPVQALHRLTPVLAAGGYTFAQIDPATGIARPVLGRSGRPFVLDFNAMRETLKQRKPGAFK